MNIQQTLFHAVMFFLLGIIGHIRAKEFKNIQNFIKRKDEVIDLQQQMIREFQSRVNHFSVKDGDVIINNVDQRIK